MLGVLSGAIGTCAFFPYIRDTLARRTRPERASWLIWSVMVSIAFFSQAYEGASQSLWFVGAQVLGTVLVFLLSVPFGAGAYADRTHRLIFFIAALGLVLWYFTETAVYALAITIGIGLLGGSVTVLKAYRDPGSETLSTWIMASLAALLAIISVGQIDWVVLAYPIYLFVLYAGIVAAILVGRRRAGFSASRPAGAPPTAI